MFMHLQKRFLVVYLLYVQPTLLNYHLNQYWWVTIFLQWPSHRMFHFPSPDRPFFFSKSKKKKTLDSQVNEASILIYMHVIVFY